MVGTNLVKTLSKKYAQLLGEYESASQNVEDAIGVSAIIEATQNADLRKKDLLEKLEAIETVIWLFDDSWDPATVRPKSPRKRKGPPKAINATALTVLREAQEPMTSRELALIVAKRLGYENTAQSDVARVRAVIHAALSRNIGKTVEIVSRGPIRWRIVSRNKVVEAISAENSSDQNVQSRHPERRFTRPTPC